MNHNLSTKPNLKAQLDSLRTLENGWLEGEGRQFKQSDIDLVQNWFDQLLKLGDIPTPFIYPADNEAIECEWSFGHWEISFSFPKSCAVVILHATDVDSKEVREIQLNLKDEESMEKAKRFLITLS